MSRQPTLREFATLNSVTVTTAWWQPLPFFALKEPVCLQQEYERPRLRPLTAGRGERFGSVAIHRRTRYRGLEPDTSDHRCRGPRAYPLANGSTSGLRHCRTHGKSAGNAGGRVAQRESTTLTS